jgi:hypothetical protein
MRPRANRIAISDIAPRYGFPIHQSQIITGVSRSPQVIRDSPQTASVAYIGRNALLLT